MSKSISAEQEAIEQDVIDEVVASFNNCDDLRLREVMVSLVKHLHHFMREVRLTRQEFVTAIQFLTDAGHITDDKRQEFILLSDVLGASMQMVAINNPCYRDATEATVFGPFHVANPPHVELGDDIAGSAHGDPCWVEGTVRDTDGNPVPGARIEVWESDEDGNYDVQYSDDRIGGRARLDADDGGEFYFWGLKPTPYPIPYDGPVGQMLKSAGRSPWRPAHLHFMVSAPGQRTLVTHIFDPDDPQLADGDAVFGVKNSLIKQFEVQPAGTPTPDGRDMGDQRWARCRFDIVLAPEQV